MHELATTEEDKALSRLSIGAYFFAMRSCEYLHVSGERRTRRLQLRNIRFFRGSREIDRSDPDIHTADAVSITFDFQKNDKRNVTITMYRTDHSTLCPVRAWAAVVEYLLSCPNVTDSTPVSLFYKHAATPTYAAPGSWHRLTGTAMTRLIRRAATSIGSTALGFTPDELGTHSIRSGAAMAMHLDGVPVYTIMLIGRWSSDAFLVYLRPQVMQFTQHIARRMIKHQHFFSIPTLDPVAHELDPAQTSRAAPRAHTPAGHIAQRCGATHVMRTPFNLFVS